MMTVLTAHQDTRALLAAGLWWKGLRRLRHTRQNQEVTATGRRSEAFGGAASEIVKIERVPASIFVLLSETGHKT